MFTFSEWVIPEYKYPLQMEQYSVQFNRDYHVMSHGKLGRRRNHCLWRVAFALAPTCHLRINEETLMRRDEIDESSRTSWLDAEPMWLEPQMRKTGRAAGTGRTPEIVDLKKDRMLLRRLAEQENAQIARARC